MIVDSKQDFVVVANSSVSQLDVVALANAKGDNITVRVLNYNTIPIDYQLQLDVPSGQCQLTVTTYAAPNGQLNATNPATDPYRYVPKVQPAQKVTVRGGWNNTANANEFATLVFEC